MKGTSYVTLRLVCVALLGGAVVVHAPSGLGNGVVDFYVGMERGGQVCSSVVPTSLDFGEVLVGDTPLATFTISNAGAVDLNVTSIAISGPASAQFNVDATPFTIPPDQSRALEVRFTPDQFSPFSASLDLVCDGVATSFALSGSGTNLRAVVRPINTPVAGDSLELAVDILPESYQPDTREFLYRPTGQTPFASVLLAGSEARAVIPAEAVTPRGLDYYFRFARGPNIRTVPGTNPEDNPIRLRVQVEQLSTSADLRPLQYQMVSVPLELTDTQIAAVLEDDYDAYDPDRWRLFRWDPALTDYREFPDLTDVFTPGMAFWLNTRAGEGFDIEDGLSVVASRPYSITLSSGWNQIGTPFAFPIAWDDVAGSSLVEAPVAYDGTEYQYNQTILEPWQGYFVYNPSPSPVTVAILPVEAVATPGKAPSMMSLLASGEYVVKLSATVPGYGLRDSYNYLGFNEHASPGRDCIDFADPPGIGNHLRLNLIEDGEPLAGSFKPIGGEGQQWAVEIAVEVEDEVLPTRKAVQVALQEHGKSPAGFAVYVLDKDLGRAVEVVEGAFSVEVSPSHPVRHLQVIVGTKGYAESESEEIPLAPLADALYQNYPNPFNPETVIGYVLNGRKEVALVVYDVLGRRVRELVRGEQRAGRYEAVWDGRDDAGVPVSSGMYVVRLKAGRFRAVRTMLLLR